MQLVRIGERVPPSWRRHHDSLASSRSCVSFSSCASAACANKTEIPIIGSPDGHPTHRSSNKPDEISPDPCVQLAIKLFDKPLHRRPASVSPSSRIGRLSSSSTSDRRKSDRGARIQFLRSVHKPSNNKSATAQARTGAVSLPLTVMKVAGLGSDCGNAGGSSRYPSSISRSGSTEASLEIASS